MRTDSLTGRSFIIIFFAYFRSLGDCDTSKNPTYIILGRSRRFAASLLFG